MTDEYLCGAVSQYRASKRIFFRRNKTNLGPLRLAKLFWNKKKMRLINVHHPSKRSARLLII